MLAWLLNIAYLGLIAAVSPVLLFRVVVRGKYRTGWDQKLWGRVPRRESKRPCLWLHAVSVGEVLQLQPVLEQLASQHPEYDLVISTTTATGYEVARSRYPQHPTIFFPLDFTWSVKAALERIRPAAIVLVELELWPNFIFTANRMRIPVVLINGRISERSFRGYRRIRPLMRVLLQRLTVCAVQNETYASRLRALGAQGDQLHVTGSIKFDRVETDRMNPRTTGLKQAFGIGGGDIVFIAGSTQAPEEQFAIETYLALRDKHPRLRLLLVPRHRERFEEVARLVTEQFRLPLLRRSQHAGARPGEPQPVMLLDTLGELSACWGLATVAFVGGSLTRRGGQNMIEPAGFGAAVLFGPNTQNFRDVVESLRIARAATVVRDAADLTAQVDYLLSNPLEAAEAGVRAQTFVVSQSGATSRTLELIQQALPRSQSPGRVRAA